MRSLSALLGGLLMLSACSRAAPAENVPVPEQPAVTAPASIGEQTAITKDVVDQVAHLLHITANGQLTPLAREAEKTDDFQSNFGGQSHSRHWFLLRRVGVDPVEKLHQILEEPYGVKRVGNENWYIWPDFAALSPNALIPERLSFQDRARLRKMVGDEGIARIRSGEPYPGVRTAISGTGRWVYFIHDVETIEEPE